MALFSYKMLQYYAIMAWSGGFLTGAINEERKIANIETETGLIPRGKSPKCALKSMVFFAC
jgi:hypothetical protein